MSAPVIRHPSDLTTAEMKALRLAALPGVKLWRTKGGYGRTPQFVSIDIAGRLIRYKLCRVEHIQGNHPRLVATGYGLELEAIASRRAAAIAEARRA